MNFRIEKINKLIKKNISDIFLNSLSLKEGVFITVSKVDTSADFRYARVFVSVFPEKEINYIQKTIEKEKFKLQRSLNKNLRMKPLPKLEFLIDLTELEADKIEKILKEIEISKDK